MRRPRRGLVLQADEWPWWIAGILTPLEAITFRIDHLTRTLQIDHEKPTLRIDHETRTLRVY